jgi:hypothetical protein
MRVATIVPVLLTVAACARGEASNVAGDKAGGTTSICNDLAIAAELTRSLYEQSGQQLASAGKAMEKADRWDRKEITAAQDGTGEYSGALRRAFAYERTATALCYSGLQADHALVEMASRSDVPQREDVARWRSKLSNVPLCSSQSRFRTGASAQTIMEEWTSRLAEVRAAEDGLIQACYQRAGGSRPADLRLPPMLLVTE